MRKRLSIAIRPIEINRVEEIAESSRRARWPRGPPDPDVMQPLFHYATVHNATFEMDRPWQEQRPTSGICMLSMFQTTPRYPRDPLVMIK